MFCHSHTTASTLSQTQTKQQHSQGSVHLGKGNSARKWGWAHLGHLVQGVHQGGPRVGTGVGRQQGDAACQHHPVVLLNFQHQQIREGWGGGQGLGGGKHRKMGLHRLCNGISLGRGGDANGDGCKTVKPVLCPVLLQWLWCPDMVL